MQKSAYIDGQNESIPVPDEITCGDQIFDIDFYPMPVGEKTLAVGLINGHVELWRCKYEKACYGHRTMFYSILLLLLVTIRMLQLLR